MQNPSAKNPHDAEIRGHVERIHRELEEGFAFMRKYPKSVTIFGSSMIRPEDKVYKLTKELAALISSKTSYAILTGGGPGIMEAANMGVYEAGGQSLGMNISLPHDHMSNKYTSDHMKFAYFFIRKAMMTFTSEAYIFLPGGFGTFDELFSILTLIQTGKIPRVPVILFGSDFWKHVVLMMRNTLLNRYHTIVEKDFDLFRVTDSQEEVIEIIKKAPVMEWWRNIN